MASPQLELYHCATAPPAQALQMWNELLDGIPVEDFDYPAQRLLPAVWSNLKKTGQAFPQEPRLRGVYRLTWIKNSLLQRACLETLDLFEAQQLPVIVLKGQAFNTLLYHDQGMRSANDFDLLVPFQRAPQALALLAEAGWQPAGGKWPDPCLRLENAVALKKGRAELDLHWYLLREARKEPFDAPLWQEAVPFSFAGREALTLCPTHHLFHLLVSASREPESLGRYLLDLRLLTQEYAGALDQRAVLRLMEERHLLSRLNGLPLAECGLTELTTTTAQVILDRAWSHATRYVSDGSHEWHYLIFPFLDFWLHYRTGQEPKWNFWTYIVQRLEVSDARDFFVRTYRKLLRMAKYAWR